METEAMAQGLSSLPADLVNRVADCLLATNDLDYYIDLRAICHHWRFSSADPKTSHDARFRPTRWIELDELSEGDTRFFVNATTGRFLRDHHFVSSTTGGLLVLADREPQHAARVLNPFTGSLIRFMAPVPCEVYMTADVAVGDPPTLALAAGSFEGGFSFYLADPHSENFAVVKTSSGGTTSSSSLDTIRSCVLRGLAVDLASSDEMLRVDRSPQQGVHVFRMDSAGRATERVTSIDGRALFVGTTRCFSIHADSFPSINTSFIYYQKRDDETWLYDVYEYDLAHDKEERIADEAGIHPASILELLVTNTMYSPGYQAAWYQLMQRFSAHHGSTVIEKIEMA